MSDAAGHRTEARGSAAFLLVHGSAHGAWCWRDTIPALEALGHRARAIDLPSHGADPTPASEVTLDAYARAIVSALDDWGDDTGSDAPAILVGHSMAGYPITAAAELAPEKVARLVYLCAYVPRAGHSLADLRRMGPSQPLRDAIVADPTGTTFRFDPDKAVDRLYHDVALGTAAWAVSMLGAQPIRPQETVLAVERALRVPRSYIRCTGDRAIPPAWQAAMSEGWPAADVTTLPTSHSPFLSDPAALAARLDAIARS